MGTGGLSWRSFAIQNWSRSNRRSHRRTRWASGASCLQSKASTTLSLACAPTAPNSSARWSSTRTSTDSATCEALRASSSRWPRNSSEAFTAFGETAEMGVRNYLIEGVSGTGKTTVAEELQRRGYHVIHGDRELSYLGDPESGEPLDGFALEHVPDTGTWGHGHHLWDVDKVKSVVADQRNAISFFCGGPRNFSRFMDLFDGVFVLDVDLDTLNRRLAGRPEDEFGGRPSERELIVRLHGTKEDIPKGSVAIDATAPLERVVD